MAEDKTELELLKEEATALGVDFHPAIGLAKLQKKINTSLGVVEEDDAASEENPLNFKAVVSETALEKKKRQSNECKRLVRCRIVCLDPAFKEWEGQIFTVGNGVVGTIRKYIAFGVPYHVPNIILQRMKDMQHQVFSKGKDSRGRPKTVTKRVYTYAIEELPPLTEDEFNDLKKITD